MPDIETPDHWNWKRLDELGEWNTGGTPRRSTEEYWEDGTIPWVTPKEMKRTRIDETEDNMTELGLEESTAKLVPEGTVLFVTRSGILEHSLPVAIANTELTVNQDMKTLSLDEGVLSKFVLYFSQAFEREILNDCTKDGTTVASIDSESLYSYEIPLPPIDEQTRIVERVEAIFTKIETGVNELEECVDLLENYTKVILKNAFDGTLSESFDQEFDSMNSMDEINSEQDNTVELNSIPSHWNWTTLGDVCDVIPGNSPPGDTYNDVGDGIPLINGPDEFGNEHFSKTKTSKYTTDPKKMCQKGDLIICVRGSTTGRTNIASCDSAIGRGVAAIRARHNQKYINYYIHFNRGKIFSMGSGSTFPSVSSKDLRQLKVPLPPEKEQEQIVELLDDYTSVIESTKDTVENELTRTDQLTNAVLQKAFKGKIASRTETANPVISDDEGKTKQVKLDEIKND